MSYGMVQQQVQKLVMTPQLRQAIQLLQLPTVDLAQYVQNELLANPVLEGPIRRPKGRPMMARRLTLTMTR